MKKFLAAMIFTVSMIALGGCLQDSEEESRNQDYCGIESFAESPQQILYFSCTGREFYYSLTNYLRERPHLKLVAISGDGTGLYGVDIGYLVVTEPLTSQPTEE